jgi:hypothetical protein
LPAYSSHLPIVTRIPASPEFSPNTTTIPSIHQEDWNMNSL